LQFYFNGHAWLANQLKERGIAYEMVDNAFIHIANYAVANQLASEFDMEILHLRLDEFAQQYCPVVTDLRLTYHWSIMQAEFATDLVFKRRDTLQAFYPHLLETLTHAVKPADIATFLGRKLHGNYQGELGNRFNRRWLGTRIKHQMGPVSIKMYDKFNLVLRIETIVNTVSFFKHYRQVQHRDGSTSMRWASMKKTIHSLPALQEVLSAANGRYLKFISSSPPRKSACKNCINWLKPRPRTTTVTRASISSPKRIPVLFRTLLQGEFFISGFTNKQLRSHLSDKSPSQVTRLLKRLRVHGVIKKVGKRYKYYLTDFGPKVLDSGLVAYQEGREQYAAPLRDRLQVLDDLWNDAKSQLDRILDLYISGDIPRELLLDKKQNLESTLTSLNEERQDLVAHLESRMLSESDIDKIREFAAEVAEGLGRGVDTFERRRGVIELLDVRASLTVENGEKIVEAWCFLGRKKLSVENPTSRNGGLANDCPWSSGRIRHRQHHTFPRAPWRPAHGLQVLALRHLLQRGGEVRTRSPSAAGI
jgi:DNA-binding Lrp family transcriptional regulator